MGCSDRVQCAKGGVLLWRDVDEAVTTRRYGRRGFFVNVAASSSVHFCLRLHSCPYLETIFVCVCVCVCDDNSNHRPAATRRSVAPFSHAVERRIIRPTTVDSFRLGHTWPRFISFSFSSLFLGFSFFFF